MYTAPTKKLASESQNISAYITVRLVLTKRHSQSHNFWILSSLSYIHTLFLENEETEGSDGQAEYLFGEAELDDDDLYSMEHDNQAGQT